MFDYYEMLDMLPSCPADCSTCPGFIRNSKVIVRCVHDCHEVERGSVPTDVRVEEEVGNSIPGPSNASSTAPSTPTAEQPVQSTFQACAEGKHIRCPGTRGGVRCQCDCHPWRKK